MVTLVVHFFGLSFSLFHSLSPSVQIKSEYVHVAHFQPQNRKGPPQTEQMRKRHRTRWTHTIVKQTEKRMPHNHVKLNCLEKYKLHCLWPYSKSALLSKSSATRVSSLFGMRHTLHEVEERYVYRQNCSSRIVTACYFKLQPFIYGSILLSQYVGFTLAFCIAPNTLQHKYEARIVLEWHAIEQRDTDENRETVENRKRNKTVISKWFIYFASGKRVLNGCLRIQGLFHRSDSKHRSNFESNLRMIFEYFAWWEKWLHFE